MAVAVLAALLRISAGLSDVATTTIDKLIDYVFNTPQDPGRSVLCVQQRCDLIKKNLEFLATQK